MAKTAATHRPGEGADRLRLRAEVVPVLQLGQAHVLRGWKCRDGTGPNCSVPAISMLDAVWRAHCVIAASAPLATRLRTAQPQRRQQAMAHRNLGGEVAANQHIR